MKDFLLVFSRFNNLRGRVETAYFDNGSTLPAAAESLPALLKAPELKNSLH